VHTFTIGFDEAAYDETRFAREVADVGQEPPHELRPHRAGFQEQLPDAFRAIDQPTSTGSTRIS
jgi:asparagine synthetase B (glutamine-hydrolysing)